MLRIFALGLMGAAVMFGQEAQLNGRVTDSSGAVIPDVKDTLTNTGTGGTRDVTTNCSWFSALR
jgi:hypothetical protein